MTVEKRLEKKLREQIKAKGGLAIKTDPSSYIGMPDRVCLLPGGKVIFAELKSTGKKPSRIQKKTIERLRNLGFDVRVIDKNEQLKELIDAI